MFHCNVKEATHLPWASWFLIGQLRSRGMRWIEIIWRCIRSWLWTAGKRVWFTLALPCWLFDFIWQTDSQPPQLMLRLANELIDWTKKDWCSRKKRRCSIRPAWRPAVGFARGCCLVYTYTPEARLQAAVQRPIDLEANVQTTMGYRSGQHSSRWPMYHVHVGQVIRRSTIHGMHNKRAEWFRSVHFTITIE